MDVEPIRQNRGQHDDSGIEGPACQQHSSAGFNPAELIQEHRPDKSLKSSRTGPSERQRYLDEVVSLESGTADKSAVDVGLGEELLRVGRLA